MTMLASPAIADERTMADVLKRLGGVSPRRVRVVPAPGTATERDLLAVGARSDRIYELIDGVLVEKTMGYFESFLAVCLARLIGEFVQAHDLGVVTGADGPLRILPNQVRVPDVSFVRWDRFPNRRVPRRPIPILAPDLAVEVLSKGNRPGEMRRKLRDYFEAGVQLVWYVDPRTRTVEAYTSPEQCVVIHEDETLDGGDVLPGFRLRLADLFSSTEDH